MSLARTKSLHLIFTFIFVRVSKLATTLLCSLDPSLSSLLLQQEATTRQIAFHGPESLVNIAALRRFVGVTIAALG